MVAPAAGRDLEHAGFDAGLVNDRPDPEGLQQAAASDVLGQFFDGDAATFDWLSSNLLKECRARARGDLLNGSRDGRILRDGRPKASLSAFNPSRSAAPLSSS